MFDLLVPAIELVDFVQEEGCRSTMGQVSLSDRLGVPAHEGEKTYFAQRLEVEPYQVEVPGLGSGLQ